MKSRDFDKIVQAYRDRYGIDLSHMRMRWSKHPVYNDGRRSYEFDDDETGGSWVDDGTIRVNPNLRPVMDRFGVSGSVSDFRRRIMAHELAHEVWHNQGRKERVKKLIRDSLSQARKENFTTPYLDTYPSDTPKNKFDSELFAEWMSHQLNKQAQSHGSGRAAFFSKDVAYDDAIPLVIRSDDDGSLQVLGPKGNDPSDTFIVSEQEANNLLRGLSKMKVRRGRLPDYGKYERPWTIDQIRQNLGDAAAGRLAADPVHKWRSDTGIELIHKEPTKEEFDRIVSNWKLMDRLRKRRSDRMSRKLFGMTNMQHARRLSNEEYQSGSGKVESYEKDKTDDHDEIVVRLKDGSRVRISNNTRLGRRIRVEKGDTVNYHGYRVKGTDVVHRVHPNRRSRGGWLERLPQKA